MRTIVEINHDFAHEIEANPEAFVRALMDACLVRGRTKEEARRDARCMGAVVRGERHHSYSVTLTIGGYVQWNEPASKGSGT